MTANASATLAKFRQQIETLLACHPASRSYERGAAPELVLDLASLFDATVQEIAMGAGISADLANPQIVSAERLAEIVDMLHEAGK